MASKGKSNGIKKAKREVINTYGTIDATMSILGKLPNGIDTVVETNPFGFVVDLCKRIGVYDELLQFLINFITVSLPTIELGVKGVLLANLKNMASGCDIDPMIPNQFRLSNDFNDHVKKGFSFHIPSLDYANILSYNPFSPAGEHFYCGLNPQYRLVTYGEGNGKVSTEPNNGISITRKIPTFDGYLEAKNYLDKNNLGEKYYISRFNNGRAVYELVRAADFNAFLWFVINKGRTHNPNIVDIETDIDSDCRNYLTQEVGLEQIIEENASLLSEVKVKPTLKYDDYIENGVVLVTKRKGVKYVYAGDTFALRYKYRTNGNLMKESVSPLAICMKNEYAIDSKTLSNEIASSTIVPYSLNNYSVNWYGNRKHYFDFLKPKKDRSVRNYGEDIGIVNVSYEGNYENKNNRLLNNESLHINILPKPLVHIPNVVNNENVTSFKRILLNGNGEIDSNGKYSCRALKLNEPLKVERINLSYHKLDNVTKVIFECVNRGNWTWLNPSLESLMKNPDVCVNFFGCDSIGEFLINTNSALWWRKALYSYNNIKKFLQADHNFNTIDELVNNESLDYLVHYLSDEGRYQIELNLTKDYEQVRYDLFDYKFENVLGHLYICDINGSVTFTDTNDNIIHSCPLGAMYECYPGLTVYEFNYDFLMSQTLFDAKVVTTNLIDNLINYTLAGNATLSDIKVTEGSLRVSEIIKNIINADTYTSTDCFFTFDNDTIRAMERKVEIIKARGEEIHGDTNHTEYNFDEVENILMEYDENATLEVRQDVIQRAFIQASATINEAVDGEISGLDPKIDIISNMIEDLTNTIVCSLITPKIIILFEINKQMYGDDSEYDSAESFLKAIVGTIVDIVKQIKGMVMEQLTDFLISLLQPLFSQLNSLLLKEYYDYYRSLMKDLINECSFSLSFGGQNDSATSLDKVDYADIDEINKEPIIKEC